MRKMPTQDLVHYRSSEESTTNYPVVKGGGSASDNSSLFIGSGQEDWVTKRRVETKTTTNVEKRVQRQVVLEDGRIIEESDPEITVDTVEDTQSHDEDGDEDRKHFGNWATVPRDSWAGDVLSEKNQRNTFTKNIQEKSVTTASARNLGDISSTDVDKVIRQGKRTRQFIRSQDDDSSSTDPVSIPAKVIHKSQSNKVLVDREDVREVSRMHEGKVKTERHVTREMIEDDGNDTPEEGDSTEETESRDGDRDGFSQRKEERFVDYYRVPKGKNLKEGKFLSHGIHLTSYDKTDQKGLGGVSAISYHRDDRSDSTPPGSSGGWPSRPPRSSDQHRRRRSSSATPKRSSTRIVAAAPSTPRDTPDRFNTIERSTYKKGSKDYYSGSKETYNGSKDHYSGSSSRRGTPSTRRDSFRSRSVSQSPQPNYGTLDRSSYDSQRRSGTGSRTLVDSGSHHRSMTTLRSDLDDERSGRLKRAMSFSMKSVGPIGAGGGHRPESTTSRPVTPSNVKTGTNGLSLLGSVKSLYATIRRKSGKENKTPMKGSTADLLFDNGVEPPQRPPRKHQSSSSVTSGNSGQFNSLDRRGTRQSTSQNDLGQKWSVYPPPPPPQQHQQQQQPQHHQSSYRQQQPSTYKQQNRHAQQTTSLSRRDTTASTLPRRDVTSAALKRSDDRKYQSTSSFVLSPGSVSSGGGGSRHRSASRSRYDELDNRDPPRFEPERQRDRISNARFFGQDDDADDVHRDRPRPDMRRLLLNGVNRSASKVSDMKPAPIRAM